jgi:hypothetical protein
MDIETEHREARRGCPGERVNQSSADALAALSSDDSRRQLGDRRTVRHQQRGAFVQMPPSGTERVAGVVYR